MCTRSSLHNGSGVKNVTRYLKVYSGGTPEFIEADTFKQVIPVAEHKSTPQVTPQAKNAYKLIGLCAVPRSRQELMVFMGLRDKKNFAKNYINPLIKHGFIVMTNPDNPRSQNQKYVQKSTFMPNQLDWTTLSPEEKIAVF